MIDVSSTRFESGASAVEFAWCLAGLAQLPRLSGSW